MHPEPSLKTQTPETVDLAGDLETTRQCRAHTMNRITFGNRAQPAPVSTPRNPSCSAGSGLLLWHEQRQRERARLELLAIEVGAACPEAWADRQLREVAL